MIDRFRRIAQTLQFLRLPSVAIGLVCLASMVVIVLTSEGHQQDTLLIPSLVGLLWAVTTHAFLATFRFAPEKADPSWGIVRRLGRYLRRAWYWAIGIVFLATTTAAVFVTYRMVSAWLRDYGG
jgi:hypothetical protein